MEKVVENRLKWIETGYRLFGEIGLEALNVEKLSNLVGLNRSSFYHYFKDLSGFEEALFDHHHGRYQSIAVVIEDYDEFEQLFNKEVFEHKDALAFQRQLLINQSITRYKSCSESVRRHTEEKTFALWTAANNNAETDEKQWAMFRAMRDFYFVHHGQSNGLDNPKEFMLLLNQYVNQQLDS